MSGKKKNKRRNRHKRLVRNARLQAARNWLPTYTGKNVVRGYRKHFGVDALCAIVELQLLGVPIQPGYIESVERSRAAMRRKRAARKERKQRQASMPIVRDWDETYAYIAGYTAWGFPYGVTWLEMERSEHAFDAPAPPEPDPTEPPLTDLDYFEFADDSDYL